MTEKKLEKIGIDHGFRNMKTRSCIFDTALSKLPQKPDDLEGVLEHNNEYYCIYGRRITSVDTHNKADSYEFYLLTLAAIAKELKARKTHIARIYLSVGLPQKWYFSQREAFVNMLEKEKELQFRFEGTLYIVDIEKIRVYIQGYAAAISLLTEKYSNEMVVIVDIGGETFDIIPVDSIRILRDECRIETKAGIWLTRSIAERINSELYEDIPEAKILQYLLQGNREKKPVSDYERIMKDTAMEYCSQIYRLLREYKLNPALVPVIFVGGGAGIMRRFGTYNPEMTNFIEDLRANARGYEYLDELYYSRK